MPKPALASAKQETKTLNVMAFDPNPPPKKNFHQKIWNLMLKVFSTLRIAFLKKKSIYFP